MQRQGRGNSEAAAFASRCESLLVGLSEAARCVLPPGWRITPFGSYVQGTCLPGAALDVALVPGKGLVGLPGNGQGSVETLAAALVQRTTAFIELPLPGPVDRGPLRLLAGSFAEGQQIVRQEVALYLGDSLTGRIDTLLRQLLDTNAVARAFVMLVKHWTRSRGLTQASGGSFQWTLLTVFMLQQHRLLPALGELCEGQLGGSSQTHSTAAFMRDPETMLRSFADFVLGHFCGCPGPTSRISLWTGLSHPGPSQSTAAAARRPLPTGLHIIEELRRLLRASGSGIGIIGPWTAQSKEARCKTASSSHGYTTPPPRGHNAAQALPPIREVSSPSTLSSTGITDTGGYAELPPFPRPPPANSPAAAGAAGAVVPEIVAAAGDGADTYTRAAPGAPQAARNAKWRINEAWVATCVRDGRVLETVKLDPHMAGGLTREDWERRICRRMHQIRIGKATQEYRRWQQHFACHGRQPGDPETPRAVEQNSKKQFEDAYKEWRVRLHGST